MLCLALTACGGEKLPTSQVTSVSESTATSSESASSATQQPVQNMQLTADMAVEGSLRLVESNLLSEFDYYGAFTNGWAFVAKGSNGGNMSVGYMSEEGEYKPLYTIPKDAMFESSVSYEMETECYNLNRDLIYYLTNHFACNENGVVPYYQDGKWGYSDLDGNIIVEPNYIRLTPLETLGMGCRKDDGSMPEREYDIFDANGNVIASGNCWADTELGYYIVEKDSMELGDLCNADGSVVLKDVLCGYGNFFRPMIDTYPGGIVTSGIAYDRTGKKLEIDPSYAICYINEDGFVFYNGGEAGVGVLDQEGNVVIEPSIIAVSVKDDDGNYIITQKSGIMRKYDAQFNEVPSQLMLNSTLSDSHFDETTGDMVGTVTVFNQDGESIMQLESNYSDDYNGMYCIDAAPMEGDWMYWFPNDTTRIVYHVERAQ